jgi:addiction module HigA family antidote
MPRTVKSSTPVHPGEILLHDFLEPMGLSQYRLARDCGFSPRHVNELVKSLRAITAPTALALGKYFGVDPQWWMNMQAHYELELARRSSAVSQKIARVPARRPKAA